MHLCSLSASNNNMNGKPTNGKGTCSICWNQFKTHSSDGAIHRHGLRSFPCPRSSQPPVKSVALGASLLPSSSSSQNITDSENKTSALTQPDSDIEHHLIPPATTFSHPVARGALVKGIPRSARASTTIAQTRQALGLIPHPYVPTRLFKHKPKAARHGLSSLLTTIIGRILQDPTTPRAWQHLLSFGAFTLAQPTRGGTRHNLTSKIKARTSDFFTTATKDMDTLFTPRADSDRGVRGATGRGAVTGCSSGSYKTAISERQPVYCAPTIHQSQSTRPLL